jgi:hypothetical protein
VVNVSAWPDWLTLNLRDARFMSLRLLSSAGFWPPKCERRNLLPVSAVPEMFAREMTQLEIIPIEGGHSSAILAYDIKRMPAAFDRRHKK